MKLNSVIQDKVHVKIYVKRTGETILLDGLKRAHLKPGLFGESPSWVLEDGAFDLRILELLGNNDNSLESGEQEGYTVVTFGQGKDMEELEVTAEGIYYDLEESPEAKDFKMVFPKAYIVKASNFTFEQGETVNPIYVIEGVKCKDSGYGVKMIFKDKK